ncbi:MAG: chemotaxis protein CheW [Chloroflexi bacterium]|nr:chemotaxis protein CheW [Chloroflexota bacterium]
MNATPSGGAEIHGRPADEAELLARRARWLADVGTGGETHTGDDILVFGLRGERYAAELRLLHSVRRLSGLTSVPCAPSHIAGIVTVRGEVIAVIDPSAFLGLDGEPGPIDARWVVFVHLTEGRVGLIVDEVLGICHMERSSLVPSITGRDFIVGIHGGTTVLLDLERLLTSDRLDVHDPIT